MKSKFFCFFICVLMIVGCSQKETKNYNDIQVLNSQNSNVQSPSASNTSDSHDDNSTAEEKSE